MAPRSRRPAREVARDAIRDVILEAAERTFARGFDRARMADVAAEAGMATGTLYNYFENKDELYHSLMEQRGSQLLERLSAIAGNRRPALDRLRALIESSFQYLQEHRALYAVFVEVGDEKPTELRERYLALFERVVTAAQRAGKLRKDIAPRRLTAVITGAMNGVMRAWIASDETEDIETVSATVFTLLLEGASKP